MQMAQLVAAEFADEEIKVSVDETGADTRGFADTLYMNLNVDKLKQLGWKAEIGLADMYKRMIGAM